MTLRKVVFVSTLFFFCLSFGASAQSTDKYYSTNSVTPQQIDATGKRIPWYVSRVDDGQTRSEVDLSFAPSEMKIVGPSPEAARATKYSDYPVSYGLGLVDVSIPLYVVKSHSLSLPISLCYDSGGIRVDDFSGPVGLGWTLEAGGVITRSVSDVEDESTYGWANRWEEDPLDQTFDDPDYLAELADGTRDTSADIFSYNFCGHKGSFYIDWLSDSLDVIPTSATDLIIEVTIDGFLITDTDGTQYSFTQSERSERYITALEPVPGVGTSSYSPAYLNPVTAWYLTEIASMDRTDVISLKYKTYEDFYTKHSFEPRSYQFSYQYDALGSITHIWRDENGLWENGLGYPEITCQTGSYELEMDYCPQYLDSILFSGGNVAFEYINNPIEGQTSRKSYPRIMDCFTVNSIPPASATNTEVFRCTLNDTLRTRDKRNLLKEVVLTGRGGAPIESYSFTYIGEETRAMTPNSKDLFGYYNAANNGGTAFLRLFSGSSYFSENMANRNYNSGMVSTLSLETISTASGAKTEFVYEGNSITTNYYGALFSTIGIGHRIHRINTYDLSGGGETLVRKRDFSYSSPGITVPEYAFVLGSFVTVNEAFREDLLEWSPSWTVKAGWHGMARSAIVVFNDQSAIPGVPLESARLFYGNVTERVSGPDFTSPSVRTDYVFDTSDAVHEYSGASWILGVSHDNHDNSHNTPGSHIYHFFQRPPYSVPRMGNSQSVNFTPNLSYFIPGDLPQLTSPTVIRRYKSVGYTETLVSETVNEYELNDKKITTGYQVKNMIALGDEDYLDDEWDMEDFFRTNLEHKLIWYRLKKTTEREWLDDGSTQESVTTYTYLPASNSMSFIPTMGSVLTPKSKTTIFGSETTGGRTYSREYVYPTEIAANVPWASQIVSRGYRQAIAETITAGVGSSSASTTREVTWSAFTPQDVSSMTIYRPSSVTIARREPGTSTFEDVGPNIYYEAYDSHGNVLQVKQDTEKPVTYIWGYGGLRPVMEITGGNYSQVRTRIGDDNVASMSNGMTTLNQLTSARSSLETSETKMLVSWYLYDMPFGMSQASDISRRLTKYEYDGAGRLLTVKDENNNRVNTYTYALTNGGSGSPNSITSVTHTTTGSSASAGVKDVAYFDGLGRTVQTVAAKASTSVSGSSVFRDLVTPFVPDFLDREDAKAYIPYPASTTTSNSGSYRSNALSSQQSYHGSGVRAYTEIIYEISDRNRVIASSLPGFTETTTTQTKESPANTVLKLSFNASQNKISASGYYNNGRFVCTITEGPDGSYTEVYTDEIGTPVLERVKLDASGTMADTYYIRDVLGRVLCVVPPAESAQLSSSTSNFSATNCYTYAYDGRDRVENRHTPAGVMETITYNNMDLPETRTRRPADGVNVNEVFATTYDGFNRPTLETYKYGSNAEVTLAEYMYDTYPSDAPSFSAETGYVTSSDTTGHTRGLKTAERVTLLPAGTAPSAMTSSNTSTKEFRAIYYDAKGRIRQVARTNPQGGTDRISSSYDFAGNLLKERQKIQPGSGQATHTFDRTYVYDARLRLNSITANLDGGTSATQTITYDDLQRTYTVNRGSGTETTTMLYTLQGWLSSATSTSWEETLRYASPQKSATDALPGKVGLITEWVQQQKGTNNNGGSTTSETYTYSYDKAGRLIGSLRYAGSSSSGVNTLTERNITYDRSGNLLSLDRYGSGSGTTPSESLSYSYSGPKRSTWTYDSHANVTADPQSGLNIAWNALDLPRTITSGTGTSSVSTQRSYLADGSLAQVSDGSTTRLYLGDMVFNKAANGTVTLESAGWEGGRLLPGSGSDKVLYVVKDHLGSVRVVKDGAGNIRQRFDYYPYGTVSRMWTNSSTTDVSEKRYRFGGKEIAGSSLTDLAGYGSAPGAPYLDFGARLYSPRTVTWLSPDPLMEEYYRVSPFMYCVGNPVILTDQDGRGPLVGALVGAGLDAGIQIFTNILTGEEWYRIDGKSVAISAGAGAVGAGLVSKVRQAKELVELGKTAVAITEVFTEAAVSGVESAMKQFTSDGTVSFEKTALDATIGAVASGFGQVGKSSKQTNGGSEFKALENQLDRLERVAGDNPRASRQAKVNDVRRSVDNYGDNEKEKVNAITTFILTWGENYYEDKAKGQ